MKQLVVLKVLPIPFKQLVLLKLLPIPLKQLVPLKLLHILSKLLPIPLRLYSGEHVKGDPQPLEKGVVSWSNNCGEEDSTGL